MIEKNRCLSINLLPLIHEKRAGLMVLFFNRFCLAQHEFLHKKRNFVQFFLILLCLS